MVYPVLKKKECNKFILICTYLYVRWVDSKVSHPKQNVHFIFTFLVSSKYTKQFPKTGMKIEISLDHPNIKLFLQNDRDKIAGIISIVWS